MKEMFSNTKIIVSSILPRKELAMKMLIASLNDFLLGMCTNTPNTEFMRNNNIKHYMLTDKKHINENGFKSMLSNIRYTIFGRIPRVSPNSTNNRRIHLDSSLRWFFHWCYIYFWYLDTSDNLSIFRTFQPIFRFLVYY